MIFDYFVVIALLVCCAVRPTEAGDGFVVVTGKLVSDDKTKLYNAPVSLFVDIAVLFLCISVCVYICVCVLSFRFLCLCT